MPICYQLIGVPGSGKTTWVSNQNWTEDCVVVSTDEFVEKFAQRTGKTYNEVFDLVMPRAIRLMMRRVRRAEKLNKDIIWDQTSTTIASRAKKFRSLQGYDHIAVLFPTPTTTVLMERLNSRQGKNVPWHVVSKMASQLEIEPPTEEEGFKEVWRT